jgi:hypothetical protein
VNRVANGRCQPASPWNGRRPIPGTGRRRPDTAVQLDGGTTASPGLSPRPGLWPAPRATSRILPPARTGRRSPRSWSMAVSGYSDRQRTCSLAWIFVRSEAPTIRVEARDLHCGPCRTGSEAEGSLSRERRERAGAAPARPVWPVLPDGAGPVSLTARSALVMLAAGGPWMAAVT